jgi:hypothetical protein
MATIDNIKTLVNRRGGFAKPNRFRVDLGGILQKIPGLARDPNLTSDLNFLVDSISIPTRSVNTFNYSIWNHDIKIPIGYEESEIEITFNITNDFITKKIMDDWSKLIIDQSTYLIAYSSEYKCDIDIHQLDENNKEVYSVKLKGAYPTSVKGILLDNNSESAIGKFSSTLVFDRFEVIPINN